MDRNARSGSLTWPASACTTIAVTGGRRRHGARGPGACAARTRRPGRAARRSPGRARSSASRDRNRSAGAAADRGSEERRDVRLRRDSTRRAAPSPTRPPTQPSHGAGPLVLGDRDEHQGGDGEPQGRTESPNAHAATNPAPTAKTRSARQRRARQARQHQPRRARPPATAYDVVPSTTATSGETARRRHRRRRTSPAQAVRISQPGPSPAPVSATRSRLCSAQYPGTGSAGTAVPPLGTRSAPRAGSAKVARRTTLRTWSPHSRRLPRSAHRPRVGPLRTVPNYITARSHGRRGHVGIVGRRRRPTWH